MAPTRLPSCGFVVSGTKKGDIPVKVEKRAKGKRVTVISNVSGDATKLLRALQALLGVGGTVRSAGQGQWSVEVQGDQTQRVVQAALDFGCLQGIAGPVLEEARGSQQGGKDGPSAVGRTAATKFLAQTNEGQGQTVDERRKMLEMESEFYSRHWDNIVPSSMDDDLFSDVWAECWDEPAACRAVSSTAPPPTTEELNLSLQLLGMLSECGRAVREFWDSSGMTIQQFRKFALNPGARLVTDDAKRRKEPSNLVSRQKLSDWKSRGGRQTFFAASVAAIDNYEKGIGGGGREADEPYAEPAEEPALKITEDADGWLCAALSYCVPFQVPATRLAEEERGRVARAALRLVADAVQEELLVTESKVAGVKCRLDVDTFGLDLSLSERGFLYVAKADGAKPGEIDKEELRLEKKLREICSLRGKQLEGAPLEKLQLEKVAKRSSLFEEVAELKCRRAEKYILRVFKRLQPRFRDVFHEQEWDALYGDDDGQSTRSPFGTFDVDSWASAVTISSDGLSVTGRSARWVGGLLHLAVHSGEVGAFALEVVDGLLRVGWSFEGACKDELGSDGGGFGFGGTGKKVHDGSFETYGQAFKKGDVIHCEAERDAGVLRIGFAKNSEPLGVAFEVSDPGSPGVALLGTVCGKDAFNVRLVSAECVPLEDAPVLEGHVEYDPPLMAVALRSFTGDEDTLDVWEGETIYVSCDDGRGWLFAFFLDPEDPDDGGWIPADVVQFIGDDDADAAEKAPEREDDAHHGHGQGVPTPSPGADVWDAAPLAAPPDDAWGSAPPPEPEPPVCEGQAVVGLDEWLRGLSLLKYSDQAVAWCEEMGAVSLSEVTENWEEFCDALGLKPLERKRVAKAAAA